MALPKQFVQEEYFLLRAHSSHTSSWLRICLYSCSLNATDTSQQTRASWAKSCVRPPSLLLLCTHSLFPTVLLIHNLDVAAGPPGTQGVIAMTMPTPAACEVSAPPCTRDL